MKKLVVIALMSCFTFILIGCQDKTTAQEQTSAAAPAQPAPEAASAPVDPAPAAGDEEAAPVPEGLARELAHHNFIIKSVDGKDVNFTKPDGAKMDPPNMSFGQWPHVNGTICNSYRGQVEVKGDTLTVKNAASTMKLCLDQELNQLEGIFHQMLNAGVTVTMAPKTMTLTGNGHTLVFELSDYVN